MVFHLTIVPFALHVGDIRSYILLSKQLLAGCISCQFTSILGFLASEDTSSAALLTKINKTILE